MSIIAINFIDLFCQKKNNAYICTTKMEIASFGAMNS